MTPEQATLLLLALLILVAITTGGISLYLNKQPSREWWVNWLQGISTEAVGAIVTALLFAYLVGPSEEEMSREHLLQRLNSTVNSITLEAIEELKISGLDRNGYLSGRDFSRANWEGMTLTSANLNNANLNRVNLLNAVLNGTEMNGAILSLVNFGGAQLINVELKRADLVGANLAGANLTSADLYQARLCGVDLRGANLSWASLESAIGVVDDTENGDCYPVGRNTLEIEGEYWNEIDQGAIFDESTILPDRAHWTPTTDMRRFTDSTRADFYSPIVRNHN